MVILNILAILYVILYCTTGTLHFGNTACYEWKKKIPKYVTQLNAYSNVKIRKIVRDGKKPDVGNVRLWSEGEKLTGSHVFQVLYIVAHDALSVQSNAGLIVFIQLHKYIHPLISLNYIDQAGFLYLSFYQTPLNEGSPYDVR